MTLHSLGYAAVAPSGENVIIREEQMKELRERFKKVILLFDNDGSFTDKRKGKGKYATRNYVEEYDIPYTFIPEDKAKDISDFYKAYGRRESQSLMKQIVKDATLSRE